MIAQRFIRHVTLNTGHTRNSVRSEISDEAMAVVTEILIRARSGERVMLPGEIDPKCWVEGSVGAKSARLIIHAAENRDPILDMGIALHSRAGKPLWHMMHVERKSLASATMLDEVPPEPWVAAVLLPGIARHMEAASWLGDMERCLAWGFLELVEAAG